VIESYARAAFALGVAEVPGAEAKLMGPYLSAALQIALVSEDDPNILGVIREIGKAETLHLVIQGRRRAIELKHRLELQPLLRTFAKNLDLNALRGQTRDARVETLTKDIHSKDLTQWTKLTKNALTDGQSEGRVNALARLAHMRGNPIPSMDHHKESVSDAMRGLKTDPSAASDWVEQQINGFSYDVAGALGDLLDSGASYSDLAAIVAGQLNSDQFAPYIVTNDMLAAAEVQSGLSTYKADGVEQVEWLLAADPCGECEEDSNGGNPQPIDSLSDTPPVHINAVLAGSTFVPYVELSEMVSGAYNGPAITISAGSKSVTIGPNHPMLTSRGLVKAKFVRKGDQLLYDTRHERSVSVHEAHFKQVPLVEDAFNSFGPVSAAGLVTSSHDFHGDRIFCQGEVQVKRPTRPLLDVPDLIGLEQLREGNFMLPDVGLVKVATTSSFGFDFRAVLLSSSSGVSCRSCGLSSLATTPVASGGTAVADRAAVSTLTRPVLVHPHIVAITVDVIQEGWFEGRCFDASTGGLYASNGFLVSNCRCDIAPVTSSSDSGS
jgi:hypothetical protein